MTWHADFEDTRPATLVRAVRRCAIWTIVTLGLVMVAVAGFLSIQTFRIWQQLPSAAEISVHYFVAGEIENNLMHQTPTIPNQVHSAVLAAQDPDYLEIGSGKWRCLRSMFLVQPAKPPWRCRESISDHASQIVLTDLRGPGAQNWPALRILMALKLEHHFSRHQILDLYIRHAHFGRKAYGVERAATAFYDKSVSTLSLSQTAMLAGLLRSPSRFDPARDPDRAKQHRDLVLMTMMAKAMISQGEGFAAQSTPLFARRKD